MIKPVPQQYKHPLSVVQPRSMQLEQVPPHNERAEAAVVGSMLISAEAADIARETLTPEDFYIPRHRLVFEVLSALYQRFERVDELMLCAELNTRQILHSVGGRDEIGRLIFDTPTSAGIEGYCDIVLRRRFDRQAIVKADALLKSARDGSAIELLGDTLAKAPTNGCTAAQAETTIQDAVAGRNPSIDFPNFPQLSEANALAPGSIMALCGSGGVSKSFLVTEWVWRLNLADVPCAVLELDKTARFHLNRGVAQMCGEGRMLGGKKESVRWLQEDPARVSKLIHSNSRWVEERNVYECIQWIAPRFQEPKERERKTWRYLTNWVKQEIKKKTRVIIIDNMSRLEREGRENMAEAHDYCVKAIEDAVKGSGSTVILVCHPKDQTKGGIKNFASMSSIAYGEVYARVPDDIAWLEYMNCSEGQGALMFNRRFKWLKTRNAQRPPDVKLFFSGHTLHHMEVQEEAQ